MVNHGRSGGCVTCKARRVKCDEAKPDCRRCLQRNLPCGGYDKAAARLRFKDETAKLSSRAPRARAGTGERRRPSVKAAARSQVAPYCPAPRCPLEPDTAVEFFLAHYVRMGRSLESTRGFFELIIPGLRSEPSTTAPLPLVVAAVARKMFSVWREGPVVLARPNEALGAALASVRAAVNDPLERTRPTTLLAVLVLQYYENIVSTYARRQVSRIHFNGAVSLFPSTARPAPGAGLDDTLRAYTLRYLFHFEVGASLRNGRLLPSVAYSWLENQDFVSAPPNPSSALDILGASLSNLQITYIHLSSLRRSSPSFLKGLVAWQEEAEDIEAKLASWVDAVPPHWHPVRLRSGLDFDPSIPSYGDMCDAYVSCQVATIWNTWRLYVLILAKMRYALFGGQAIHKQKIQDLMDHLCHSVPYYLGNRTQLSNIRDFTDPGIHLASYQSLAPEDARLSHLSGFAMSEEQNRRHVLAQGAWHAMGLMVRLLRLFSEEARSSEKLLRPGQQAWLGAQFRRSIKNLGLDEGKLVSGEEEKSPFVSCGGFHSSW